MNYERIYRYRFRDTRQADRAAVWRELAAFVHAQLGAPERVLDPAAGRGEFINAVPARERWAVDLVAHAEGTIETGVRLVVADVFDAELPAEHFDAVWVSNFLEHLPTQEAVAAFLERMHGLLRPGGRIAVIGPNFRYCAKEYFDMADHTVVLTHRALAEHLYGAGFEPERVEARFLPYSFTGRLPASARLTRAYLHTPAAWWLLGKQFLAIARRP
ncbi:MAG: class I SAM-dependent methyltransferase [Actinobacteria bacterium]|nr:class I SAM-dependent methyltransferase [Actinomycetota bacterium]